MGASQRLMPIQWGVTEKTDRPPVFDNPKDEVLRRVGRNLVIFQQAEGLLKFLLSTYNIAGTPETFVAKHQEQVARINRTMLGNLVEAYKQEVLQDAGAAEADEPMDEDGTLFRFRFTVRLDSAYLESLRADLKAMTDERNELVHNFLPRWQPDDDAVMQASLSYLDEQRERVLPILEHLRTTAETVQKSRETMRDFFLSEDFERTSELMWLQSSPLVSFFREVSRDLSRKDGWTYLAWAGKLACDKLPEEVQSLKERYGHKTLKKLLIASDLFDILDEPVSNGTFRTLYRVRAA